MKRYIYILTAAMSLISCSASDSAKDRPAQRAGCEPCPRADYNVIPAPEVSQAGGTFILKSGLSVGFPEGDAAMERNAAFLAQYIQEMTSSKEAAAAPAEQDGISLTCAPGKGDITLSVDMKALSNPEAYDIKVTRRGITITGGSPAGVYYGIQTLRKSLPAGDAPCCKVAMPCGRIGASPRFAYRGVLFDTARHYFGMDYLKPYLDIMALHGCNRFHWHLTDDQGWRFEVKAFPLLTEIGSVRDETQVGNNRADVKYDGIPHGGFYTQDECRELVAYAAGRNIEIIPEIDLPGHMQAALAAYPQLGCSGGPYDVRKRWGISEEVLCAGNPATLDFLKAVLDEVMDVFPSRYIHIGGDECPRTRWHDCPKCQAKADELGFVDGEHPKEAYLQSYIMTEIESYLSAHGRSIIGWDEMLEGNPSPDATVMAWRAVRCGADAVKGGHPVIMTPQRYCYFDFDQVTPVPGAGQSGMLPLRQVYDFEPVPAGLTGEEESLFMGVQANEWSEYIATEERASELLLPRLAAMSEVQWLPRGCKDYFRFMEALPRIKAIYEKMGFGCFAGMDDGVNMVSRACTGGYEVSAGVMDGAPIHYTTDGTDPSADSPLYEAPLKVSAPLTLKMAALREGGMSEVSEMRYHIAKSTFKPVTLQDQPALVHSYDGACMLTDGLKGPQDFRSGYWLGFEEKDVVATIDMGEATEISSLRYSVCIYTALWLFNAVSAEISASRDGKEFSTVASEAYPEYTEHHFEIADHELSFAPVKARYFRVKIECPKVLPPYHNGRSHALFMFVDEISLD